MRLLLRVLDFVLDIGLAELDGLPIPDGRIVDFFSLAAHKYSLLAKEVERYNEEEKSLASLERVLQAREDFSIAIAYPKAVNCFPVDRRTVDHFSLTAQKFTHAAQVLERYGERTIDFFVVLKALREFSDCIAEGGDAKLKRIFGEFE